MNSPLFWDAFAGRELRAERRIRRGPPASSTYVESVEPVVEQVDALTWRATRGEAAAAVLSGWRRPDGRFQLSFQGRDVDAAERLLSRARRSLDAELLIEVDPKDGQLVSACEGAGFDRKRTEVEFSLNPHGAVSRLVGASLHPAVSLQDWDAMDLDRLRALDDGLRQDVPGTDGWRWTPAGFVEEIAGPHFHRRLYAVAVEAESAEYVGLCRVWSRGGHPARLGMIGVVGRWRRRGVAGALLASVLAECARRSTDSITLEIDDRNAASMTLFRSLGAAATGSTLEMSAAPR